MRSIVKLSLFGVASVLLTLAMAIAHAADPLPSWQDGPTKDAIVGFVDKVTQQGSPDFVPEAERIATFDNDGTLWAEQPMYFQLLFALDRVKALAPKHPEWRSKEPFASLLKGDVKAALAGGEHAAHLGCSGFSDENCGHAGTTCPPAEAHPAQAGEA